MRQCKCGKCRLCWLTDNTVEYAKKFGEPEPIHPRPTIEEAPPLPVEFPCVHRLERTAQRVACDECQEGARLPVLGCELFGTCTYSKRGVGVASCCKYCKSRMILDKTKGASTDGVGVVLGAYKWPELIRLQIRLVRHTCGAVPILVSDDMQGSPVDRSAELRVVCESESAEYVGGPHIGHGGGDVAAFHRGVLWATRKELRVLAKLSQRFLVLKGDWLQKGAAQLLDSGLPLATRHARPSFPLRTEACLLDVAAWGASLNKIEPKAYFSAERLHSESVIRRALDSLGGKYWPLTLFGPVRRQPYDGTVWHNSHGREAYETIASLLGVTLDEDFHTDGWQNEPEYSIG